MAETTRRSNPDQKPAGQQKGSDRSDWLVLLFLLCVAPPIGALLLVLKVLSAPARPRNAGTRQGQPMGARTTAKSTPTTPSGSKKSAKALPGKAMTTVGAILSVLFAFISVATLSDALRLLPNIPLFLSEVLVPLCFLGAGIGVLWCGLRRQKQARRFRKYLSLIGKRKTVSIHALAEAMPARPAAVRRDLEDMLDSGIFPTGYLDYGGDRLVLSDTGLQDEPPATQTPSPSSVTQEDAILAEIRALNASIAQPQLSAQIDRIEEITAKIFDYRKVHPEKTTQLHTFLSYYLPTTLKILRAYARLESQGVEGENITAAMSRIEDMMAKVVDGFEKQLDQLFQSDAMDIASDIAVLERMLCKDGLSSDSGLQLEL